MVLATPLWEANCTKHISDAEEKHTINLSIKDQGPFLLTLNLLSLPHFSLVSRIRCMRVIGPTQDWESLIAPHFQCAPQIVSFKILSAHGLQKYFKSI